MNRTLARSTLLHGTWIWIATAVACSSSQSGVDGNGVGGGGFSPTSSQGGNTATGSTSGTGSSNGTGSSWSGTGSANATGSNTGTGTGTIDVPAGCSVGSQGCYCDTIGGCLSGLSCKSSVCCDAGTGDCSPSSTTAGTGSGTNTGSTTGTNTGSTTGTNTGTATSTDASAGICAPGVIGTMVSNCGYTFASSNPLTSVIFNESEVLAAIVPTGGSYAKVRVFYGDEHALTLGVRSVIVKSLSGSTTTDYPVTPLSSNPSSVVNPQTGSNVLFGNQAGLDPSLRPMWPALFITDVTNDPNSRSGDWQYGGRPYNPNEVYGTWKSAVRTVDTTTTPSVATITPDADPAKNNWNLGAGADPVPASLTKSEGYGAEIVWNLALIPGHSYRVQAMVHDGDQNKVGGDSGEACVNFCAGGDTGKPDGGVYVPPGGGTGQPPQCEEGASICGPGGIDPNDCPLGYICANGCCTWNVG